MKILVLNTGSSTVKFSLIESAGEATLLDGLADWFASPAKLTVHQPGAAPRETPLAAATPSDHPPFQVRLSRAPVEPDTLTPCAVDCGI